MLKAASSYPASPVGLMSLMLLTVPSFSLAEIVINEIHADPASGLTGDANGDGIRNATEDEFVEIVNNTGAGVDISGWTLSDSIGIRHVFPAGTVVPDQCSIVVFGGGSPTGDFGNSLVQTASNDSLALNNGGDNLTLNDGASDVAIAGYGGEGNNDQSLTLDPDITGLLPYVLHTLATGSGGTLFSPGTQIDGSPFIGCSLLVDPCAGAPPATPDCTVNGVPGRPCEGTPFPDTIVGTPGNDVIRGLGGDDQIEGLAGNNCLDGGAGNDAITAGNGLNSILAGSGHNHISVGDGDNLIVTGASGNNVVITGNGNNLIATGSGHDWITTGAGADTIEAGAGNNMIAAGAGMDTITAGGGHNRITAGADNDMITTGFGHDMIDGGAGIDDCDAGILFDRCSGCETATACEGPL